MNLVAPSAKTPRLEEALALAREALRTAPSCFWNRQPDAPLSTVEDVRLIVRRLRENGNRAAWRQADRIESCL